MSDIFISYSSADRAKAQQLARILEGEGWSVWWDRKILPGRSFDETVRRMEFLERFFVDDARPIKLSKFHTYVEIREDGGNRVQIREDEKNNKVTPEQALHHGQTFHDVPCLPFLVQREVSLMGFRRARLPRALWGRRAL